MIIFFISLFARVYAGGILDLDKHLSDITFRNNLKAKLSGKHNLWEMVYDRTIDDCLHFLISPAECRLLLIPFIS